MRKRRRNIIIINNEIDYDKLADVIVNAQNKKDKLKTINSPEEKIGFCKAVWRIIVNKQKTNGTMFSGLLSSVLSFAFNVIAVLAVILSVCVVVAAINIITQMSWSINSISTNVATIAMMVMCFILSLLLALVFRASANEIAVEKDRNYIVAVFSGIVGFAALAIAFISVFQNDAADIVELLKQIKEILIK